MTPRFGLLHLFESPRGRTEQQCYADNIELIEYAEAVGLDSVWLAEHHFSDYGVMPSTQVFGSYIAARTERRTCRQPPRTFIITPSPPGYAPGRGYLSSFLAIRNFRSCQSKIRRSSPGDATARACF